MPYIPVTHFSILTPLLVEYIIPYSSSNLLKAPVYHIQQFITLGRASGQVLMSIRCDKDIVLNTNASNGIVGLEDIAIDKLGVCRVVEEVSLNERSAEVTEGLD